MPYMKYNFDDSIGRITLVASRAMGKDLVQRFNKAGIKITSDEWTILAYLARYNVQSQKELAEAIAKDKVSVTRHLSGLEIIGYVERDLSAIDSRSNSVKLSKQGYELYKNLKKLTEDVLNEAYKGLSHSELQTTVKVLNKIVENLNKESK